MQYNIIVASTTLEKSRIIIDNRDFLGDGILKFINDREDVLRFSIIVKDKQLEPFKSILTEELIYSKQI